MQIIICVCCAATAAAIVGIIVHAKNSAIADTVEDSKNKKGNETSGIKANDSVKDIAKDANVEQEKESVEKEIEKKSKKELDEAKKISNEKAEDKIEEDAENKVEKLTDASKPADSSKHVEAEKDGDSFISSTSDTNVNLETLVSWEIKAHEAAKVYNDDKEPMKKVSEAIKSVAEKELDLEKGNYEINPELKTITDKAKGNNKNIANVYDKLIRTVMTRTGNSGSKGNRYCSKNDLYALFDFSKNWIEIK